MNKTCKQCAKEFQIPADDISFYQKISPIFAGEKFEMPAPNLCFACRHQKRLAFRNEMELYHRKCDISDKQIISMYPANAPYKIIDQNIWWGDSWDPLDYGRDFDFGRSFFEQFKELQAEVPRMSLNNRSVENSEYCNLALDNKNCYLIFTADYNDNCAYLRFSDRNYRSFDSDYTYDSIDCYGCMDCEKCNGCEFAHKCVNSSGLSFCHNMIGCHDCLGSANLRNKQYYIFNEQYSREDYEKKKAEFALGTYSGFQQFKQQYEEFLAKQPRRYLEVVNCEKSVGDYLRDSKNSTLCYNGYALEDCKYMINCWKSKDCYDWDFVGGDGSELCHEMANSAYNVVSCHFCNNCWENVNNLYYSELCLNSKDCFGSIGLRHKQYCILNKQYSKEEYEKMVAKIIKHMQKSAEWGEFFPMELSVHAYNETVANEYFEMTKEQVGAKGWKWHDDETEKMYKGPKYEIPDDIKSVDEDICKQILICEETGKPYKVVPQELKFCKMKGLPIPRLSPRARQKKRMALRNPWSLYVRKCDKCSIDIQTTYSPSRPEPVYCESCYQNVLN